MPIEIIIVACFVGMSLISTITITIVNVIEKIFCLSATKESLLEKNKLSALEREILTLKALQNTENSKSPIKEKEKAF